MIHKTAFAAAVALTLGSVALAQTDDKATKTDDIKPLTIGDPARSIDISDWLKGDKVTKFESGKVYVVEFWATWCGPCKMSMPHLTKMQEQYKDYGVTFIGVSDEKVETVKDFLPKTDKKSGKTWNEIIGYTLTTDPDKSVYNDYFKAAGQDGIPTAFIIGKDSKIEWIGHPMEMDAPLESVVKDTWDRGTFKTKWEKEQASNREAMKSQKELGAAMKTKDWPKVMTVLDSQIAANKEAFGPQMQKFALMLTEMNEPTKGYAFGEDFAKNFWDNAMNLNQISWFVVDPSAKIQTRNYDFALKVATRAVELTKEKDGAIIDTLAHAYAGKGDYTNAVKYEKMAVDNAPEEMKEELQKALEEFQAKAGK